MNFPIWLWQLALFLLLQNTLVRANRDAEHLVFPLKDPGATKASELPTTAAVAARLEARPGLEAAVKAAAATAAAIERATLLPDVDTDPLDGSGQRQWWAVFLILFLMVPQFLFLPASDMNAEEARQKLRELGRLRALQSQYEAKNRRIKKIKSKAYRKIRKKVRVVKTTPLFSEVDGGGVRLTDILVPNHRHSKKTQQRQRPRISRAPLRPPPGYAGKGSHSNFRLIHLTHAKFTSPTTHRQRKLLDAERARAEERVSLRHKNKSKWIRRMLEHGDNQAAREAVAQQLELGRKLRQKIAMENSDDEDDGGNALRRLQAEADSGSEPEPEHGALGQSGAGVAVLLAGSAHISPTVYFPFLHSPRSG